MILTFTIFHCVKKKSQKCTSVLVYVVISIQKYLSNGQQIRTENMTMIFSKTNKI